MTKAVADDIARALGEAIAIARNEADPASYRVHVPVDIDVRGIRRRTGMTQDIFCATYGFPIQTLRDREQGRSRPDTSARDYLLVISREPILVRTTLQTAADERSATASRSV